MSLVGLQVDADWTADIFHGLGITPPGSSGGQPLRADCPGAQYGTSHRKEHSLESGQWMIVGCCSIPIVAYLLQIWRRMDGELRVQYFWAIVSGWAGFIAIGKIKGQGPDLITGIVGSVAVGLLMATRGRVELMVMPPTERSEKRRFYCRIALGSIPFLVFLACYAQTGYSSSQE